MICLETIRSMDELGDRQQVVARVVRRGIQLQGIKYVDASRNWPIALPTLNRLMKDGNVGLLFYRIAERSLGLPTELFDLVLDADVDAIRKMPGLDANTRSYILREMGAEAPAAQRRRKS